MVKIVVIDLHFHFFISRLSLCLQCIHYVHSFFNTFAGLVRAALIV